MLELVPEKPHPRSLKRFRDQNFDFISGLFIELIWSNLFSSYCSLHLKFYIV